MLQIMNKVDYLIPLGGCVGVGLAFFVLVSFLGLPGVEALRRSASWMIFFTINEGDVNLESLFWFLLYHWAYLMVTVDSLAPAGFSPVIILISVGKGRLIWLPMLRCFNLHRGGPAGSGKNERIDIFVFFLFWVLSPCSPRIFLDLVACSNSSEINNGLQAKHNRSTVPTQIRHNLKLKEKMSSSGRRLMIGSMAPHCTYNECRGCRFKCQAEQVPVDTNDPMNSAYRYRCVCHR
ncbi:hypothetical protein IEQ34_008563 [Dendrobium chrysotoxum]|uniref:Stomagen C-terminal domain-containing protein n=1 Tax=Dendrobium chrysotoxum TaxID=161865 RepID=A0AAV7GZR7_DENCH|nr:hypothetical protein IEQ34_008563 [Dendrobium chrysotoxum]